MVDIFGRGVVDQDAISASVAASRYFRVAGDEPAWRTLAWAIERTDDEFAAGLVELERQFEAREIVEPGALLHTFGVQIELAKNGLRKRTLKRVVREAKRYIEDLLEAGKLKPLPLYAYQDDLRHGGWGGSTFTSADTEQFAELFAYLREKRILAREATYPTLAEMLLKEMTVDPSLFIRRISASNSDESIYTRTPVLAALDPTLFLDTLATLHPEDQHSVLHALRERYNSGGIPDELAAELPWIRRVRSELKARAHVMGPIAKWRTSKLIEWYLDCFAPPKAQDQPG